MILSITHHADSQSIDLNVLLQQKKYTIFYFYPKDDTPGCTVENKNFSDYYGEFIKLDCQVFGVSRDNESSHTKFCTTYDLKVPLVSDKDLLLQQDSRFLVWKEKSMYGKKYMGTERSTFLLNDKGHVIKEWRKVSPQKHTQEVLAFVQNLV